ncbi:hypothetical protein G6541_11070 [Streptomyces albidoflavus]|nr:hypothetical protein [Streptomyces albidoflavus]
MPVQPIPCAPGGGGDPGDNPGCCSPSIATTPLCREDGTSVLLVVRSGCEECGGPAADPTTVGWIDPATGTFTAGPAPDAVPCDALTCVDTVCRQLCDDTDGDGEADTTYTELWCVRADGSAELVLTYRGDPSQPYTPLAPVECAYGCPEDETLTLCDDSGPFLRRYTWLGGSATYADYALDGVTAHVVTGTVTVCSLSDCEAPTTPAATLGLCLADGTPIAVLVTRDCGGQVTQDGWLNLTTGAWSAGGPPAGTMACGNPRNITTAGTFCDVDPDTGDVLGLVLVEYTYAPDGAVDAVRLVDATTGQTYTPQGEVTACPTGVEQPERDVLRLCDTAPDGTVTEFVRDYARDEAGAITGHADYFLDGTPYTPAGTVGRCVQECQDCQSVVLCDTVAGEPVAIAGTAAAGTLSNGVGYAVTGPSPFAPERQSDGAAWWGVATFPNPTVPLTRWTFDQPVNVDFSVAMVRSPGTGPGDNRVQVQPGAVPLSLPAGYSFDHTTSVLTVDATVTGCTLNTPSRAQSARFRVLGVTEVTLQYLGARSLSVECQRFGTWEFGALDVSLGGQFLRTTCRDCTGAVTSTTDTLLDGETPYTPLGLVGVCQPDTEAGEEEPCRDTYTTQVCDLPTGESTGAPTATNTSATAYPWDADPIRCVNQHPGGGQPLWDGGTVTIPARASGAGGCTPNQWLAGLAATLQADRPTCDSGTVTITVAVAARNNGPSAAAANYAGSLRLHRTDTGARLADSGSALGSTPAGTVRTLTATATGVPAALLAAGQVVVALDVESWDQTGNTGSAWELSNFTAVYEYQQDGCETRFLRKIVTDCETGQTVSVTDTTLDGDPYTVTGEVGECTTVGGGSETGPDVELVQLCDVAEDGTSTPFLRALTFPPGGGTPTVADTLLDGVTPYVPAGTVDTCATASTEPCRDASTLMVCDLPLGGDPTITSTNTDPLPYKLVDWPPANTPVADGSALWAGGQLTIGPDPDGGTLPVHRWTAATVQSGPAPCPDAVTTLTVRVHAHLDGPAAGFGGTGALQLFDQASPGAPLAHQTYPSNTPVGYDAVLEVSALVDPVRLAAGEYVVVLNGETYHQGAKAWTYDGYEAEVTWDSAPCGTQFLRTVTVDCETGQVVATSDTTMDGAPYTVTGEVGQCQTAGGECCPSPLPEPRVDVEAHLLCIRDQDGEITGQVIAEHVYDNQTGERLEQRLTDPTTGDAVTLPAGAELVACEEPPCPVAFATECVGIVERTEASYDNTSMIGGVPGQCGGVQGPNGQFPCQPPTGGLTIVSWIVNGEEVIGDGGREFAGGPCGLGTAGNVGMHVNWSAALTNLDPTGATWSAQTEPACLWFVGSTGGTQTTYGPMVVEDAGGQQWTLTPAQSCTETQFTKVYTQECDGTVSVSWLDADGVATDPPEGQQVPCGTGCGTGGGRNLDVEPLVLCDAAEDGTATEFLRHLSYNTTGQVGMATDTGLDGFTPYTPTGTVTRCQDDRPPSPDVELLNLCDVQEDGTSTPFLRHLVYPDGAETPTVLDTSLDGVTPYAITGTVGVCPQEEACPSRNVLSACRWDDTDGNGIADQEYVELLAVDCDGVLSSVGTYTCDLAEPYTPVAPAPAPDTEGADPAVGVQAHRVELPVGASWDVGLHGTLRSVTATAHTGTGQVTTADGSSTLFRGETVTWGVDKEIDARLTGPLIITAVDGIVTVAFTTGVNL